MTRKTRDLAALLQEALALKTGNKEFALFRLASGTWRADIGNKDAAFARSGEWSAEVWEEGATPEEALERLIKTLRHLAEGTADIHFGTMYS